MKARVIVATTEGPVSVLSIAEDDPEVPSVACLDGTVDVLPISADYNKFVQKGTGVVARVTNHSAYRIDLDAVIDGGRSWQLPVYIAHMLYQQDRLASRDDTPDFVVFASGEVAQDGQVRHVKHIPKKLAHIREWLGTTTGRAHKTICVLPKGQLDQAERDSEISFVELDSVKGISELEPLRKVPKAQPVKPEKRRRARTPTARRLMVAAFAIVLSITGIAAWTFGPAKWVPLHTDGYYLTVDKKLESYVLPVIAGMYRDRFSRDGVSTGDVTFAVTELHTGNGQSCRFGGRATVEQELMPTNDISYQSLDLRTLCHVEYTVSNQGDEAIYSYLLASSKPGNNARGQPGYFDGTTLMPGESMQLQISRKELGLAPSWSVVAIAAPTASKEVRLVLEKIIQGNLNNVPTWIFPGTESRLGLAIKPATHTFIR